MDYEREDGEMSDGSDIVMDEEEKKIVSVSPKDTLLFKVDKIGPTVKHLSGIDATKLEERAKRFGLNLSGNRNVTQKQIDELYTNFEIEGNERHFRLDALHLTGVDGLNTKDIFEYLEDFKPVSLEWVNDTSCNIVCQDNIAAALAMLLHTREIKDEDLIEMLQDRSKYHWREGMPHPKKDVILIRFATNADKQMSRKRSEPKNAQTDIDDSIGKNPWGDLCKSWGVYDHQEIFHRRLAEDDDDNNIKSRIILKPRNKKLAMRLGKRTLKADVSDDSDSNSDIEWNKKSKAPRMRMRADDEEIKLNKKPNTNINYSSSDEGQLAPLSVEVINSKSSFTPREHRVLSEKFKYSGNSGHSRMQSRLGAKIIADEDLESRDSSSDGSGKNTMSRVHKITSSCNKSTANVWSRLASKTGESSNHNDLRQILKTRKHMSEDLRRRLSKIRPNIHIELDNKYTSD
ncbi:unnamed protein product [Leptidea sinapis]|uniref:Nuclear cap-binding protein subunit 3 n=1 Tax=Leptidea sinapis TaxID=189913 RepID=A0A5E4PUX4_9NEOP|nr:unnamed protein product [Leptidea sinapis]VVC89857.1 unnamed protein product [Leptidea sinapis]